MPPRIDSFAPTGWGALTYDLAFGSDDSASSPRASKKADTNVADVNIPKFKMGRRSRDGKKTAAVEQGSRRQRDYALRAITLIEALDEGNQAHRDSPGTIQITTQTHSVISSRSDSIYSQQEAPTTSGAPPDAGQRRRGEPLHVVYSPEDVKRVSEELLNGTIAPVHLSLLGYWICESEEHYQVAKSYIRELSLDQGYNVGRIKNVHLRKLLQDVTHVRPKEAMSKADCKLKHIPAIRSRNSHSSFMKTFPNPFADKQVLPPVLRGETRSSRNLDTTAPLSSPLRDYPPNTPDRPEPLSVRSRGSGAASNLTPTPAYRTASSPVDLSRYANVQPITYQRNTLIFEDTEAHPLLAERAELHNASDSASVADDVFAPVSDRNLRSSKSMLNVRHGSQGGANYVYINTNVSHTSGRYRLHFSDLSTEPSNSARSSVLSESMGNLQVTSNAAANHDDFDDLEEYASTSDEFLDSAWFCSTDLVRASSSDARDQRMLAQELENEVDQVDEMDGHAGEHTPRSRAVTETSSPLSFSAFPLPPLSNPVGALPMAVVISSLASACGNLTFQTNHIRTLLQHTRARAATMARRDRLDMEADELAWRAEHEELLYAIYGKWDIELQREDVTYVERIEEEVQGKAWVWDILREDGEIF